VGAAAYVPQSTPLPTLIKTIRHVANGRRLWTLEQLERVEAWRQSLGQRLSEITARQWEVFHLLANGKSDSEICEALTIRPKTLNNHIMALYEKLDVHTKAELVALYYRERLMHWGSP
jgi:DNA-binding NarL/FixJ family response regulator